MFPFNEKLAIICLSCYCVLLRFVCALMSFAVLFCCCFLHIFFVFLCLIVFCIAVLVLCNVLIIIIIIKYLYSANILKVQKRFYIVVFSCFFVLLCFV